MLQEQTEEVAWVPRADSVSHSQKVPWRAELRQNHSIRKRKTQAKAEEASKIPRPSGTRSQPPSKSQHPCWTSCGSGAKVGTYHVHDGEDESLSSISPVVLDHVSIGHHERLHGVFTGEPNGIPPPPPVLGPLGLPAPLPA